MAIGYDRLSREQVRQKDPRVETIYNAVIA